MVVKDEEKTIEDISNAFPAPFTLIEASKLDKQNSADQELIDKLWREAAEKKAGQNKEAHAPPVHLTIAEFSRNGVIRIQFN